MAGEASSPPTPGYHALERAASRLEGDGYEPGDCKFIQIPHHGSRRNVGPAVLERLLGDMGTEENRGSAFVSAAKEGAPKHPAKKGHQRVLPARLQGTRDTGKTWLYHHEAPARPNYSPGEALPLYGIGESSDDE